MKTFVICVIIIISFLPQWIHAQSVGIGTLTPNANAALDVVATNKGLLIPRVALTSTTSNAPVGAFVAGMMVYNTATAGDVTPGFYFCNGSKWEKAVGGWSLTGNGGTNPATNFIGTTDNQDILFKRNNLIAGLLNNSSGNTAFGVESFNLTTTSTGNTAIGKVVLSSIQSGSNNTVIGAQSLNNTTTGFQNSTLGHSAMLLNTTGSENIAIGVSSLGQNSAGSNAIAIGSWAMFLANNTTTPFANTNIAIGSWALAGSPTAANNSGLGNNGIGFFALRNNSSGSRNNTLGTETLLNNTTGSVI
ncbi:MAG: hypothetical protein IPO92_10480 [Saprospiraceae bacterium]|nr:hypothetical protein [Saprospiraceae bacterium]